jgi:hypothetical protein
VNKAAVKPNGVSFASATASSYEPADRSAATGPKISSRTTRLVAGRSASTVGSTK